MKQTNKQNKNVSKPPRAVGPSSLRSTALKSHGLGPNSPEDGVLIKNKRDHDHNQPERLSRGPGRQLHVAFAGRDVSSGTAPEIDPPL